MSGNYKKSYNIDDIHNLNALDNPTFETVFEAQEYAKKNPGSVITRMSDSDGWMLKINKKYSPTTKIYELYLDTDLLKKIFETPQSALTEILIYIDIYYSNHFNELYKVNDYISSYSIWHLFSNIKSFNKYSGQEGYHIGISPDYYPIIAKLISKNQKSDIRLEHWKKEKNL